MTEKPNLIPTLKSCLPENSWSWVIPALKHDPVIWDALHDSQLLQRSVTQLTDPESMETSSSSPFNTEAISF